MLVSMIREQKYKSGFLPLSTIYNSEKKLMINKIKYKITERLLKYNN